jgi:hypothetical protein
MDYEQTLSAWKLLTEIRFKLLALVPTVAGAAVGLLTTSELGRSEEAVLLPAWFFRHARHRPLRSAQQSALQRDHRSGGVS